MSNSAQKTCRQALIFLLYLQNFRFNQILSRQTSCESEPTPDDGCRTAITSDTFLVIDKYSQFFADNLKVSSIRHSEKLLSEKSPSEQQDRRVSHRRLLLPLTLIFRPAVSCCKTGLALCWTNVLMSVNLFGEMFVRLLKNIFLRINNSADGLWYVHACTQMALDNVA
jgi:hypothetical protein